MKKTVLVALTAVLVAHAGVWLVCELVGRSVAAVTSRHRLVEPFFSHVILDHRYILGPLAAVWVVVTLLLWRRLSKDPDWSGAYIAAVVLFCIIIFITATIACILPWLPREGPFNPAL
jgi:hypothetical protein